MTNNNYITVKSPSKLSGFYVVYNGSTLNEKKGTYGISHLMEHLMCHSFDHLQKDFLADGIYWNAFTDFNVVVYYIRGLDQYVKKWKPILLECLSKFEITKQQFNIEKKIVIEEYLDSCNSQSECHQLNLYRKLFNYYTPIGLYKDIENFTYKKCMQYFEDFFKYPSKIIDISQDPEEIPDIIFDNRSYDSLKIVNNNKKVPLEKGNEYVDKSSIFNIQLVQDDKKTDKFPIISFILKMLAGDLSSPLYQEVREKQGLVYYIKADANFITDTSCVIEIYTETSNENSNIVQEKIAYVIDNPDIFITQELFDITKKYLQIKIEIDDVNIHEKPDRFILAPHLTLHNIINDLTYERMLEVYKEIFKFKNFHQSIDKKEF